ncbi:MAG: helix-turn-helix domain-containing protein [Leptospirales bacterium]
MKMIDSRYIRSLIYLNEKTITSIALETGVDPTNLSRALKGHSTVSDEKMEKVLEHLGVDPVTGTLKPVVHRWTFNPDNLKGVEFEEILTKLVPVGGKLIHLSLERDIYRWSSVMGNNGTRIIIEEIITVLEDEAPFYKVKLSSEFPEWKILFRRITPDDLKKLIKDKTLTPSEFDEVLGLKYVTPLGGDSFAAEDQMETEYDSGWTWQAVVTKAKEAGLKPEEVAERLGIEGHHE